MRGEEDVWVAGLEEGNKRGAVKKAAKDDGRGVVHGHEEGEGDR